MALSLRLELRERALHERVIMTLANGEMETRATYFPSLEKCEQMATHARDHQMLVWCRKYRPIVIAR